MDTGHGFVMTFEAGKGALRTLGAIAWALGKADALVLATDPDREGEVIAWQVLDWLEARDVIGRGRSSPTGRDYSLGWGLVRCASGGDIGSFELSFEATRRESAGGGVPPKHAVGLRLTARW